MVVIFFLLFGPQFGLMIMEGGGGGEATFDPPLISYLRMSLTSLYEYGRFPFVRIDRPDLIRRNNNQFPFNQNSPAKSVKSQILCTKENVFQQKLLEKAYFIFK